MPECHKSFRDAHSDFHIIGMGRAGIRARIHPVRSGEMPVTFMTADLSDYEEVRQRHDAFVERGRLELMAEELRANGNERTEILSSIERHMLEIDEALRA